MNSIADLVSLIARIKEIGAGKENPANVNNVPPDGESFESTLRKFLEAFENNKAQEKPEAENQSRLNREIKHGPSENADLKAEELAIDKEHVELDGISKSVSSNEAAEPGVQNQEAEGNESDETLAQSGSHKVDSRTEPKNVADFEKSLYERNVLEFAKTLRQYHKSLTLKKQTDPATEEGKTLTYGSVKLHEQAVRKQEALSTESISRNSADENEYVVPLRAEEDLSNAQKGGQVAVGKISTEADKVRSSAHTQSESIRPEEKDDPASSEVWTLHAKVGNRNTVAELKLTKSDGSAAPSNQTSHNRQIVVNGRRPEFLMSPRGTPVATQDVSSPANEKQLTAKDGHRLYDAQRSTGEVGRVSGTSLRHERAEVSSFGKEVVKNRDAASKEQVRNPVFKSEHDDSGTTGIETDVDGKARVNISRRMHPERTVKNASSFSETSSDDLERPDGEIGVARNSKVLRSYDNSNLKAGNTNVHNSATLDEIVDKAVLEHENVTNRGLTTDVRQVLSEGQTAGHSRQVVTPRFKGSGEKVSAEELADFGRKHGNVQSGQFEKAERPQPVKRESANASGQTHNAARPSEDYKSTFGEAIASSRAPKFLAGAFRSAVEKVEGGSRQSSVDNAESLSTLGELAERANLKSVVFERRSRDTQLSSKEAPEAGKAKVLPANNAKESTPVFPLEISEVVNRTVHSKNSSQDLQPGTKAKDVQNLATPFEQLKKELTGSAQFPQSETILKSAERATSENQLSERFKNVQMPTGSTLEFSSSAQFVNDGTDEILPKTLASLNRAIMSTTMTLNTLGSALAQGLKRSDSRTNEAELSDHSNEKLSGELKAFVEAVRQVASDSILRLFNRSPDRVTKGVEESRADAETEVTNKELIPRIFAQPVNEQPIQTKVAQSVTPINEPKLQREPNFEASTSASHTLDNATRSGNPEFDMRSRSALEANPQVRNHTEDPSKNIVELKDFQHKTESTGVTDGNDAGTRNPNESADQRPRVSEKFVERLAEQAYKFQGTVGTSLAEGVTRDASLELAERLQYSKNLEQIYQRIREFLASNSSRETIFMKLQPEYLGELEVQLRRQGNILQVTFAAETEKAKELLEKNAHVLREKLTLLDFEIKTIEVKVKDERLYDEDRRHGQPRQDGGRHGWNHGREGERERQEERENRWRRWVMNDDDERESGI